MMNNPTASEARLGTPIVTGMQVIPVAGYDSMLLNLCGAHAPFFTRNIVILKDNSGRTGIGEVPGGEGIRQTLEKAQPFVVGQSIGGYNYILNTIRKKLLERQTTGPQPPCTKLPQRPKLPC